MRFWLAKSSEVSVREQLATQIMFGVVSGDFAPGQKLPSTRELARRLHIHSNTVSAAYQELEGRGWLEARQGSGVYVRGDYPGPQSDEGLGLDYLIAGFLRQVSAHGHQPEAIRARLRHWLQRQPPRRFLVVEETDELRALLMAEIREATGAPVVGAKLAEATAQLDESIPVVLYGERAEARAALPPGTDVVLLRTRSVAQEITGQRKPEADEIVTIVSRWPDFLRWSHTILVAAGLSPDTLVFRDARAEGWQRGLRASSLVITESLTAQQIPSGCEVRVFRLLADASLTELRRCAAQFMNSGK